MPNQTPGNQYGIPDKGKELLLVLLQVHRDYLETEGENLDDSELELTKSLIELFEKH